MSHPEQQDQSAVAVMEREHQVQTGLIGALCAALEKGGDTGRADEILAQLVAYSSAHFMSEELLMRLAGYDGYDDHVADHIRMMDELNDVQALHEAGETRLELGKARAVQDFLLRHIETRDSRFASWQAAPA
ncbi:MAG: hemerythrin family protein [Gallionellaceae bacterium]|nr:hemerythrin family protein [Gallionellaceae bacterium]